MGGCLASPQRAATEDEQGEAFPSARLPRCVAFQSEQNGKRQYLRYSPAGGRTAIRLDGEGVISPYTRFYMEPSREHDGLVHIRCCYDNRYWVPQQRPPDGSWVVGVVDEAEEDLTKTSCTLFRTTRTGATRPRFVRILHVHLEKYVCLPVSSANMTKLEAVSLSLLNENDVIDTYTIQDLSQQVVLPRYLAFKGDNGRYLRARRHEGHFYLEFSGRDIGDEAVLNTVHTNNDGTFRVRSSYVGMFWRRSPNWIWADSSDGAGTAGYDTLFRAIRSFGGFFALQNLGNDYFCKRLTTDGKRNCLNAGTPTITTDARLQLEEAVVSRAIDNVVFDLSQARIYGKSVVVNGTASAVNGTTSNNQAKLTLEYTDKEKRTWDSRVTLKLGHVADTTTICSGVPLIVADGRVQVSDEFSGSYTWGLSAEKETTQKVSYEVTVPPKTRVTVASMATKASCDVPFSYTQRDTLVNGLEITYDMDDGLYTGVNHYDFKYQTSEEKISEVTISDAVSSP